MATKGTFVKKVGWVDRRPSHSGRGEDSTNQSAETCLEATATRDPRRQHLLLQLRTSLIGMRSSRPWLRLGSARML